jgi:hypothetical protein
MMCRECWAVKLAMYNHGGSISVTITNDPLSLNVFLNLLTRAFYFHPKPPTVLGFRHKVNEDVRGYSRQGDFTVFSYVLEVIFSVIAPPKAWSVW